MANISDEPLVINNADSGEDDDSRVPIITSSEAQESPGIGWFVASLLIVNSAIGGGLLNFPSAFHEVGILYATCVQGVLLLFIVPALLILAYCSDGIQSKTYQQTLLFTWGKGGHRFTSACMILYCFGTNVTYFIIIGDQLDQVFAAVAGNSFCHYWYMNRNFTMVVTSIMFVLPLCYPKKIDCLKHVSSVGVVAIIYVVFLIITQYYTGGYTPGRIKTHPDVWTDLFLVVPTICFGYQCHVSIIPIYSCLRKRNVKSFVPAVVLAIGICACTYTVAGTYGFLTFGSNVSSDILKSYNAHHPSVLVGNIALAIKTYVSLPINLFCAREAISDLWLDLSLSSRIIDEEPDPTSPSEEAFRRVSIASVLFTTSLIVAVLLPNIGSVIKILGSLAALFIFFLPGLCLLAVSLSDTPGSTNSSKSAWLTLVAGLYLALGAFIFGCVLAQGILFDFVYKSEIDVPLCLPAA